MDEARDDVRAQLIHQILHYANPKPGSHSPPSTHVWTKGDWLQYANPWQPNRPHRAKVVKVFEDGTVNLRVYLDPSDSPRTIGRWFAWAHNVELQYVGPDIEMVSQET